MCLSPLTPRSYTLILWKASFVKIPPGSMSNQLVLPLLLSQHTPKCMEHFAHLLQRHRAAMKRAKERGRATLSRG